MLINSILGTQELPTQAQKENLSPVLSKKIPRILIKNEKSPSESKNYFIPNKLPFLILLFLQIYQLIYSFFENFVDHFSAAHRISPFIIVPG